MPKVDFKAYARPERERLPSDLEVLVSTYGPYLSLKDTAASLKRERHAVMQLIHSGALPASRTSPKGPYIIAATDLIRYVRGMREKI